MQFLDRLWYHKSILQLKVIKIHVNYLQLNFNDYQSCIVEAECGEKGTCDLHRQCNHPYLIVAFIVCQIQDKVLMSVFKLRWLCLKFVGMIFGNLFVML